MELVITKQAAMEMITTPMELLMEMWQDNTTSKIILRVMIASTIIN